MPRFSQRRSRATRPFVIGLTGSIAMGKSTAAKMLREMGLAVFDSDAASRALTAPGGAAVAAVARRFPQTMKDGTLDRQALGRLVFTNPRELAALERIVHPLIAADRRKFMHNAARQRRKIVVLDIPLLFETRAEEQCDKVFVVSAPAFLQRQRALARPGMDDAKLKSVLMHQLPDADKRRLADAAIPSGMGRAETLRRLKKALMLV